MSFKSLLKQKIQEKNSSVCLGIDPHFDMLPSFIQNEIKLKGSIDALKQFSLHLINAASCQLPAVKFQMALYEAFGWEGFKTLQESIVYAKSKGLLTILDAKRGDIASTMKAYGVMAFDQMKADCLTVTPYLGTDVIRPLIPWLKNGKGVYVVWVSSNPTGYQIQEQKIILESTDENRPSSDSNMLLAEAFLLSLETEITEQGIEDSVGLVFGATKINKFDSANEELVKKASKFPLLAPGVGPQGGIVEGKLQQLLREKIHLLPMSRGLSGLGDPDAKGELNELNGWPAYQDYVEAKINRINY